MNKKQEKNISLCIDHIVPSYGEIRPELKSGKELNINSILINTPLNKEPNISFTSDILLARIKKRRAEKLICYKQMLKYCYDTIDKSDSDQVTDIIFTVVESVAECKDYDPLECLEYISEKLRNEHFDTTILSNTSIFITWKYLELKTEANQQQKNE